MMDAKVRRPDDPVQNRKPFEKIIKNIKGHPLLYVMAMPVILYYFVFHFLPMFGLIISFERYVPSLGYFKSQWVGLDNFKRFFNDIY